MGPEEDQGKLLLGGVDRAKCEGESALFDVEQNIHATSIITASGKVFPFTKKVGFDTGNAWFSLESLIVDGIHKDLGMDSQNWFDCDRVSNTADSFKFNLGPINISVPYTNFFYEAGFNNKCGAYIGSNNNKGAQGIGLPFLREVYFVKDLETEHIGIAPVKHTNETDIVDFWF